MQFGFPFLRMLMFCGYSIEQVASFLGKMGSGRNLTFYSGIHKNPPEKENRD
jgi:hypothetical protein